MWSSLFATLNDASATFHDYTQKHTTYQMLAQVSCEAGSSLRKYVDQKALT